jgi:hypothetical protein
MALSIILYNNDPAQSEIRSIQAADPVAMEKRLAQMFAEFNALNQDIQDPLLQWVPSDANIAGAGDGHTFIVTITWVRNRNLRLVNVLIPALLGGAGVTVPNTVPIPLSSFFTQFFMASDAQSLDIYMNRARKKAIEFGEEVTPNVGSVIVTWQQVAGASTGHRFMGGMTALALEPPTP